MAKRLRVYLSSTYEDLKEYRDAVFAALEKAGLDVARMEAYTAADDRPLDLCLRDVAQSDIYVGLYAWRYGYQPPPEHGNPDGKSITELEYRHAEARKLRKLLFFAHPDSRTSWPDRFRDDLTEEGEGGARIAALRKELASEKTAGFFCTPNELATLVLAAIMRSGLSGRPYNVPARAPGFVLRANLTRALLDSLLRAKAGASGTHSLVQGVGGFGKTTLAIDVCHHAEVIEAFPDGILWITLGEKPDLASKLVDLHVLATGAPPDVVGVEAIGQSLARALDGRCCLVVVDDAWNGEDLKPFLGFVSSWLLVTTRIENLLEQVGQTGWVKVLVDEMPPDEAVALLRRGLLLDAANNEAFFSLADHLGCWPLLLDLANARLLEEWNARRGKLAECIERVTKLFEQRGVLGFDRHDSKERNAAVKHSVAVGLAYAEELFPGLADKAAEISIFPEDVSIPVGTLARLWKIDEIAAEEDAVRPLANLSLLRWDRETGEVRLHDMIRRALQGRLGDPAAVDWKLADVALDWRHSARSRTLTEYLLCHGPAHMQAAGRLEELWAVVTDDAFIAAQLATFNNYDATFKGFRRLLEGLAELQGAGPDDDMRLCAAVLKVGTLAHTAGRSVGDVFVRLRSEPLDNADRTRKFTERLMALDERGRYEGALLGIWIEVRRQLGKGRGEWDPTAALEMCKWVRDVVPLGNQVVNWADDLDARLVRHICLDLLRVLPPAEVAELIARADPKGGRGNGLFGLVDLLTASDPSSTGVSAHTIADFALRVADEIRGMEQDAITQKREVRSRIPDAVIQMLARGGEVGRAMDIASQLQPAEVSRALRCIAVEVATNGEEKRAVQLANDIDSAAERARALAEVARALYRRGGAAAFECLHLARQSVGKLSPGWFTTDARESLVETLAVFGLASDAFDELWLLDREEAQCNVLMRIGEAFAARDATSDADWTAAYEGVSRLRRRRDQTAVAERLSELLGHVGDRRRLDLLIKMCGHLFNPARTLATFCARRGDAKGLSMIRGDLPANCDFARLLARAGSVEHALQHAEEITDSEERASSLADIAGELEHLDKPAEAARVWEKLCVYADELMAAPVDEIEPVSAWRRATAVATAAARLGASGQIDLARALWGRLARFVSRLPEVYFHEGHTYTAYKHTTGIAGQAADSGAEDEALHLLEVVQGKYHDRIHGGAFISTGREQGSEIESDGARQSALVETARALCMHGRVDLAARIARRIDERCAVVAISGLVGSAAFAHDDRALARELWSRAFVVKHVDLYAKEFSAEFDNPDAIRTARGLDGTPDCIARALGERLQVLRHSTEGGCHIRGLLQQSVRFALRVRDAAVLPLNIHFIRWLTPRDIKKSRQLQIVDAMRTARRLEERGREALDAWEYAIHLALEERDRNTRKQFVRDLVSHLVKAGHWAKACGISPEIDVRLQVAIELLARRDLLSAECVLADVDPSALSAGGIGALAAAWAKAGERMRAEPLFRLAFTKIAREPRRDDEFVLSKLVVEAVDADYASLFYDFATSADLPTKIWEYVLPEFWQALASRGRESVRFVRQSFAYSPFIPRVAFYGVRLFLVALLRAGEWNTFERVANSCPELGLQFLFRNDLDRGGPNMDLPY